MSSAPVASIRPSNQQANTPPPPHFDTPTYLMCPPQFYDVNYVLNPWMAGNLHRPSRDLAFAQWRELYRQMQLLADVRLMPAVDGLPDMVFVGHGAVVQHGIAAVSSFALPERQREEAQLRAWLETHGFLVWNTPRETAFEGEGDVLFDATGKHLWAAHGVRTCQHSHRHLADAWHVPVTSLHLVDPRFFHLDTCFAPLTNGFVLYFPEAFDAPSRSAIEAAYSVDRRIVVSEAEATSFACSAINIDDTILLNQTAGTLGKRLQQAGFKAIELPLTEFLRGGGGAKSLVLRLSDTLLNTSHW